MTSNETGKLVIAHGSVKFCEATPFDLVDEPKESLYGDARPTETCVAPVHPSRDFLFHFFSERAVWGVGGGGGGVLPDVFLSLHFSCSADHERDWLPCKVVFFGLATNTLNARNNLYLQPMIPPKCFDISPLTGGCSEGLSAF